MDHRSMLFKFRLSNSWPHQQPPFPSFGASKTGIPSWRQAFSASYQGQSVTSVLTISSKSSSPPHLILNAGTNISSIRRAPVQKAWTSTMNPTTQKHTSQPQQNGNILQHKPVGPARASVPKENITSDRHAHDRLMFILAASTVRCA